MKKCPNCGALLNEGYLFCTECGKPISQGDVCPQCGATLNDGSVFCENCGKRLDEDETPAPSETQSESTKAPEPQKQCPHCGSSVNDDSVFCENCGKKLSDDRESFYKEEVQNPSYEMEERSSNSMKIIIPILIGVVVLALIGGGWYGYKEYSAYSAAKQAREKFIADSLEQVRKDSIKLAEQQEIERQDSIENARLLSLQEPYLSLLDIYSARNDEHWGEYYFLYDINRDEFPELWLQVSENDEFRLLVYSNIDGVAKLLYSGDVGHPYHHSFYKGKDHVILNFAHMGSQAINKYYFDNGIIKEENLYTLEADSINEAEYKEISEPEFSTYDLTDKSPIYEIK